MCTPDGTKCVQCNDALDCATGEKCKNQTCVPDCEAQGCASDLGPKGTECDTARIIGRLDALAGKLVKGDTTYSGNDDDLWSGGSVCYDAESDDFYRIWLKAGDTLDVTVTPLDSFFDVMLKLYKGISCAGDTTTLIGCFHKGGDGKADAFSYKAVDEGWYTIVVDGRYAFEEDQDWGEYELLVKLTCPQTGCCCL